MIELDKNWEIDWWNYESRKSYLDFDHELARAVLINGSIEEKYFSFCSSADTLSDSEYISQLKYLQILDGVRKLPESSSLIYNILTRLMNSELLTSSEFLIQFESQLKIFSERHPKDKKYIDILAFLYSNTENFEKLKDIDEYGWKTLNLENYASSFVLGLDRETDVFMTALNDAVQDFPMSVTLTELKLLYHPENKKMALSRFVASQFTNVKNNYVGYRLNGYMSSLNNELHKLEGEL